MFPRTFKKEQIEYIIIVAIIIIVIVVAFTKLSGKAKHSNLLLGSEFEQKMEEIKRMGDILPKVQEIYSYDIDKDKTPFKSPFDEIEATEEVVLPSMSFEGMIWNSVRPQAIINNKVYDINDIVIESETPGDEVRIVDITKQGIHLKYKGRLFIIRPK